MANDYWFMGDRNLMGGTTGGGYEMMPSIQAQLQLQQRQGSQQLASQKELAQMQIDAQMAALQPQKDALSLQREQFDWKKGMANNLLGQLGGIYAASQKGGGAGPALAKTPTIDVGPIFSPEDMAMQQNRVKDRSMQQAAGVTNRMENKFATRGFSGNSPLLNRMRAMGEIQGRVGGEGAALDFSRQMATENAKNMLAGQQLRQDAENQYQQNLLSRYGIQQQGQNQFLSLLGGIMNGFA